MNYFIEVVTVSKAKTDVDSIFKQLGYNNLTPLKKSVNPISRFLMKVIGCCRILTKMRKGDILCLQYPMKKFYYTACCLAHFKGAKVATIVHDLDAFRRKKITAERERHLLSKTDFLIVHNQTMMKYIKEEHFHGTVHNLQIFDFLIDVAPKRYNTPHEPWQIVYTSNLRRWRNEFVYYLQDVMDGWQVHLYGPGYEYADKFIKGITYHGKLPENELLAQIEADFGLVWDGSSFDECSGDWGEYLRINNPHKTSLYLRAGIPVIVWSQAAMAPFVKERQVGLVVDSIRDIGKVLKELAKEEYALMKNNAMELSKMLGDGYFTKQAFTTATKTIG